jgi:23S rRNA pseudouridine2605 synthase
LPWLAPVGRLDKASEGLLLFTNDTEWADRVTAPEHGLDKVYHVQVGTLVNAALLEKFEHGTRTAQGDFLRAKRIRLLRQGSRNCWLEVVLDEGKNRHIRRLLEAFHCPVLRLIRVAIGSLELGSLAKGLFRHLTETEIRALTSKSVWP